MKITEFEEKYFRNWLQLFVGLPEISFGINGLFENSDCTAHLNELIEKLKVCYSLEETNGITLLTEVTKKKVLSRMYLFGLFARRNLDNCILVIPFSDGIETVKITNGGILDIENFSVERTNDLLPNFQDYLDETWLPNFKSLMKKMFEEMTDLYFNDKYFNRDWAMVSAVRGTLHVVKAEDSRAERVRKWTVKNKNRKTARVPLYIENFDTVFTIDMQRENNKFVYEFTDPDAKVTHPDFSGEITMQMLRFEVDNLIARLNER